MNSKCIPLANGVCGAGKFVRDLVQPVSGDIGIIGISDEPPKEQVSEVGLFDEPPKEQVSEVGVFDEPPKEQVSEVGLHEEMTTFDCAGVAHEE